MFVLKKKVVLCGSILTVSFNKRFAIAIDNHYTFHVMERDNLALIQSKKLINREKHFPYHKGITTQDGYIHLTMAKSNKSAILHFDKGIEKKGAYAIHKAYLDAAAFSKKVDYIATGGQDGKVFVFDTRTRNLVTSVPQRSDYISNLAFSCDAEYIAASCFDCTTAIYNFSRNKIHSEIKTESVLEVLTFYDNNKKIFGVERDGAVVVYDIQKKEEIFKEKLIDEWPSCIEMTDDGKYVLVGTRKGDIHGIRLKDNKLLFSGKSRSTGISSIHIDGTNVLVGYVDGHLEVLSYDEGYQTLQEAIDEENFKKAKVLIEQNLLLNVHPIIDYFEAGWEIVKEKMNNLLEQNDIKGIHTIAAPFLDDPDRKEEFDDFIAKKDAAIAFIQAYQRSRFLQAYTLAEDNPELKENSFYLEMESIWNKNFNLSKKIIYEEPRATEKVMSLLEIFKDIGHKRQTISALIEKPALFKKAEVMIAKKMYKEFFQFAEKYSFLQEFPIYKIVLNNGKKIVKESIVLEEKKDFEGAAKLLKQILDFIPLEKEVEKRLIHLGSSINFIKAVKKKDLKQSYRLVEVNPDFKEHQEFLILDNIFKEKTKEAMKYAFAGVPSKLDELLGDYMEISYLQDKIASVYKVAYLNQVKRAVLKKMPVAWGSTLKKYVSLFGKDSELEHYAKSYRLEKVYLTIKDKGNPEGHKILQFPKSILVGKK